MFKKKQKWFEVQGTLLEKRWAKSVTSIPTVRCNWAAKGMKYETGKDWYVAVNFGTGNNQFSWDFPTKEEAESACESLVRWIKEVQG